MSEHLADDPAALRDLCARLKMEAQSHAMEARGANDTIQKIYQIVTGARGEPGNWDAEVPVREEIERLRSALGDIYNWYDRDGSVGGASLVFDKHRAALLPYVKREMGR